MSSSLCALHSLESPGIVLIASGVQGALSPHWLQPSAAAPLQDFMAHQAEEEGTILPAVASAISAVSWAGEQLQ